MSHDPLAGRPQGTTDLLDLWEGERVDAASPSASDGAVELLYRPTEAVFGAVAKRMVELGWSVFPQEYDERRRPGRVLGMTIPWNTQYRLAERLPDPEALDLWVAHCPTLNAAAVMGPGSGNAWTLDVDVLDVALSQRIVALADEMFGYTPLRRVGRHPKIGLVYRAPEGAIIDSTSRHFAAADEDGNVTASDDAIEILGKGKPLTFIGKHHKTGRYFQWLHRSPLEIGPEAAPIVAPELVRAFMERVDTDIRRFHRGASFVAGPEAWEWDEEKQAVVPQIRLAAGGTPWVENAQGRVIDGREAFLKHLVFHVARLNVGMPPDQLARVVTEQFLVHAEASGRWAPDRVYREAVGKCRHLVRKVQAGELTLNAPRRAPASRPADTSGAAPAALAEGGGRIVLPVSKEELERRGMGFLPDTARRKPIGAEIRREREEVDLDDARRQELVASVQTGLRAALDVFFAEVRANWEQPDAASRIHILKAPTGAGKTSQTIRYIGENRERIFAPGPHDAEREDGGVAPIVFLLPTYANIEELRSRSKVLNLDGSLPDPELRAQAEAMGLIAEDELDAKLAEFRRDALAAGLETMVYRGKLAAGCEMKEKVELAMAAGVNSSSFCKATVKTEDGVTEEEHCPHYFTCPAIIQRNGIHGSHVVFMPHAFMSLQIPEELQHVRAVIADERVHHLFLHTAVFPITSLMIPRKKPRLTKKEREQAGDRFEQEQLAMTMLAERNEAAEVAIAAMREGLCPAAELLRHRTPADHRRGFNLVESALKVCGRAIQRDATLHPNMDIEEVRELCSQPTGVDCREEYRFWRIVQERMQLLMEDDLTQGAIRSLEAELAAFQGDHDPDRRIAMEQRLAALRAQPRKAKGRKDMRIQFVRDHLGKGTSAAVRESVRISWRTEPNWIGAPMLLLDASSAPEVIRKIWGGKEAVVHDVQGPLHVRVVGVVNRTFSNASIIGAAGAPDDERALTARRLNQVRTALSTVASLYGWGRVVAGSSIVVRRAINNAWAGPTNVDWVHYGACRGLDFAKHHAAAFSVGRMEVPVRVIDGLVAALTYDDDIPEEPYDRHGTGLNETNQPLMLPMGTQRLRMRDGRVVELPAPMYPGRWGRLMQRQYREEELLQFVGRLRPVYREGEAPVWFALSSVIPEDLIVDDLIHLDDLLAGRTWLWDAIRRTRGVADAEVLAACCPDLFADASAAARVMKEMGLDPTTGDTAHRHAWGFVVVRWRRLGGAWTHAYVLAEHADHAAVLRQTLETHLGIGDVEAEPVSQTRARTLARPRTPDKIEEEFGSETERVARERGTAEDAALRIFGRGISRRDEVFKGAPSHPVYFAAGTEENLKYVWMTHADWNAMVSIDRLWNRLRHDVAGDEVPMPKDQSDVFEQMGNHVADADEIDAAVAY